MATETKEQENGEAKADVKEIDEKATAPAREALLFSGNKMVQKS